MKCQHISTNDDGCWVCSSIRPCMALLWIIWWSSLPARNVPILEADPKVDHQHLVELSLHCRVISPPSRLIIYWWWYIYIYSVINIDYVILAFLPFGWDTLHKSMQINANQGIPTSTIIYMCKSVGSVPVHQIFARIWSRKLANCRWSLRNCPRALECPVVCWEVASLCTLKPHGGRSMEKIICSEAT